MIHEIRSSMDYRGEISDEEDSVIKFEDKREFINQKIKLMNEQVLGKRSLSENIFNDTHSVKIIKNDELILENTKISSENLKQQSAQDAKKQAAEIIDNAKKLAQDEFEKTNKQIGTMSVDLSKKIVSKVLSEVFSEEEKNAILLKAVEKIENGGYGKTTN